MPQVIQCPSCSQSLKVPDAALGKRVKCPKCSNTIAVPAAAPAAGHIAAPPQMPPPMPPAVPPQQPGQIQPPPAYYPPQQPPQYAPQPNQYPQQGQYPPQYQGQDQDYVQEGDYEDYEDYQDEDRPRRRKKKQKGSRSDWTRVRTGVTMVLSGILVTIGVLILGVCGSFLVLGSALSAAGKGANPDTALMTLGGGMIALMVFVFLGCLIAVALQVTGNVFCINAPAAAGARTLAITSLILLIGSLVLYLISILAQILTVGLAGSGGMPLMMAGSTTGMILNLLGALTWFAHMIVFQLLLRALALALRRDGLASSIMVMMIVGGVGILSYVGMFLFLILGASSAAAMGPGAGARDAFSAGSALGAMSGCLAGLLMLTWFVWYIVSLILVRSAISDKIG